MRTDDLASLEHLGEDFTAALDRAACTLAEATRDHAADLAHQRLHGRRAPFLEALSTRQEDGTYLVVLAPSAAWVEDGQDPHDLRQQLLASPKARTARDGTRYLVVPFQHQSSAGPPAAAPRSLTATLQEAVRRRLGEVGLGLGVERDAAGRPRRGLLHRLDGGGPRMRGGAGVPLFAGLSVYQRPTPGGGTRRDVLTFRTVSEKSPDGSWQHPGLDGAGIFAETATWAEEQWERVVLPELLASLGR